MTDNDKIRGFDLFINFMNQFTEDPIITPKMIGRLNKPQGINGFKVAEIGTPVFDNGVKYFIMLESLDAKRNLEVGYYKESLKSSIDYE